MMRVVFLLFAEERRLLPSDDDLYVTGYAVGQLVEQLERQASLAGEQTLEHRTAAWHRLLALTRAVHGGVAHEDLRLPAYGGGLFDPDRYPWLEGRAPTIPPPRPAPPAVDDRTVLRMLRAVQYVRSAGSGAGSPSAPWTSSRSATSTRACSNWRSAPPRRVLAWPGPAGGRGRSSSTARSRSPTWPRWLGAASCQPGWPSGPAVSRQGAQPPWPPT